MISFIAYSLLQKVNIFSRWCKKVIIFSYVCKIKIIFVVVKVSQCFFLYLETHSNLGWVGFHDRTIVGGITFFTYPLEYQPQNSLKILFFQCFLVNFGVDIPAEKCKKRCSPPLWSHHEIPFPPRKFEWVSS